MGVKIDMANFQINKLKVLHISENRTSSGSIKWVCQCDCGNICEVDGSRLRSGKAKSCGCESKKALEKGRGISFQDLTNQQFGKLTVIERIENKIYKERKFVQWKCKCACGNYCTVIADNLKSGNTQSCGFCNENSHGNIKIEQLLKSNNINFIREKRFIDCKDKGCLPFDFYVNDFYCIEYDGKQHFTQNGTIFDYETTRQHDIIKSQYCKENNIPLIRIPYTHYDNLCLEDLLLETSNFIEK